MSKHVLFKNINDTVRKEGEGQSAGGCYFENNQTKISMASS